MVHTETAQSSDFDRLLATLPLESYPTSIDVTGHLADIIHPGMIFITGFAQNAPTLTSANNEDVKQLSLLNGEEIILKELVPEPLVDLAVTSLARSLRKTIDPDNPPILAPLLKGGSWLYQRLTELLPYHLNQSSLQPIQITRTHGSELGSVQIVQGFNYQVCDKEVLIIEDLLDENLTLQTAVENAKKHGASSVSIVALVNKIGPKKVLVPEIQHIGLAVTNEWIGGGGADIQSDYCRNYPNIVAKIPLS